MKIRKKDGDICFAFGAKSGEKKHWAYLCVVRPDSQVFIEAYGNHLLHFSLHKPRNDKPDFADCHYSIPKELVRDEIVRIAEDGPDRKISPWVRKTGFQRPEAALHLIFPEIFAQDTISFPDDNQIQETDILMFDVKENSSLRVEFLFGPQDDKYWKLRFQNYGIHQEYVDLSNGERFCLNFFMDEKDYSVFQKTDGFKSIKMTNADEPIIDSSYRLSFGPYGDNTIGVVHGCPAEFIPNNT